MPTKVFKNIYRTDHNRFQLVFSRQDLQYVKNFKTLDQALIMRDIMLQKIQLKEFIQQKSQTVTLITLPGDLLEYSEQVPQDISLNSTQSDQISSECEQNLQESDISNADYPRDPLSNDLLEPLYNAKQICLLNKEPVSILNDISDNVSDDSDISDNVSDNVSDVSDISDNVSDDSDVQDCENEIDRMIDQIVDKISDIVIDSTIDFVLGFMQEFPDSIEQSPTTVYSTSKFSKCVIVSQQDLDVLNQYRWMVDQKGAYRAYINRKEEVLNRFIVEKLMGIPLDKNKTIIHINGIQHDIRRENLQVKQFRSLNEKTRGRSAKTTKYIGVQHRNGMYVAMYDNKRVGFSAYEPYNTKTQAAYAYDQIVQQNNLPHRKLNNVKKPKNFKRNYQKVPAQISASNQIIKQTPIQRNADGHAIIQIKSRFNYDKQHCIIIVDDEDYYNLIAIKEYIYLSGHARVCLQQKIFGLANYLLQNNSYFFAKHKNGNALDYRKSNLYFAKSS